MDSGKDVKRRGVDALRLTDHDTPIGRVQHEAADALAPCIVLTPEEAALLRKPLEHTHAFVDVKVPCGKCPLLDLLSPDEAGDD